MIVSLEQQLTDAITLVPIGAIAVALFAISVELYFHTNAFAQEYTEKVKSLILQANSALSARIQEVVEAPKKSKQSAIFPELEVDLTEQRLSEIRRIGAEAADWQESLSVGKSYLRRSAIWLTVCAVVLVAIVFIMAFGRGPDPVLFLEYAAGAPIVLFVHDIFRFRRIQTKLDKAPAA
jgi:hypothetical protein